MESLIADLLEFARAMEAPEDSNGAHAEAAAALADAMAGLAAAIGESDAVVETSRLPTVRMDAGRLTQVFQNLLGNAIKYRSPDRRPHIQVTAVLQSDEAVFCIADNGIGIDPAHHEQIFGMFAAFTAMRFMETGSGSHSARGFSIITVAASGWGQSPIQGQNSVSRCLSPGNHGSRCRDATLVLRPLRPSAATGP